MIDLLLVLLNLILACSLFSWKRQICEITRQIGEEDRKLRISLSNKYIENLADTINEKKRFGTKNKNSDDTGKRTIAAIYSEYQS